MEPPEARRAPATPEEPAWRIDVSCPRCGHRDVYPVGTIRCPKCSLQIHVRIDDPGKRTGEGRFQFSVRAMMLVFLLVSLPLGWVGFRIGQLRRQAAVVKELEPLGPRLHYRYGNLRSVSFDNLDPQRFDPSVLARLKELPKLDHLNLSGMPVADGDLPRLRGARLKTLDLRGTRITDAGLMHLQGIRGLRHVDVRGTYVTTAGARTLIRKRGDLSVTGVAGL